ncbi:hypothetical protein CVT24_007922 [Panaeolus cyanescens]|uniref:Uncharacterized protein n=1 Tax=Panaeolus cyanescens TaxID=181874 RepID=A0A409W0B3_9AGAR|nr:hypothetical protein CVT24_007922 [Panaeolus cyanescens]
MESDEAQQQQLIPKTKKKFYSYKVKGVKYIGEAVSKKTVSGDSWALKLRFADESEALIPYNELKREPEERRKLLPFTILVSRFFTRFAIFSLKFLTIKRKSTVMKSRYGSEECLIPKKGPRYSFMVQNVKYVGQYVGQGNCGSHVIVLQFADGSESKRLFKDLTREKDTADLSWCGPGGYQ